MTIREDESRDANDTYRDDEPDLHLRFRYRTVVFDYVATRTATENFLDRWRQSHHPDVSLSVLVDHATGYSRLPCEAAWLTH